LFSLTGSINRNEIQTGKLFGQEQCNLSSINRTPNGLMYFIKDEDYDLKGYGIRWLPLLLLSVVIIRMILKNRKLETFYPKLYLEYLKQKDESEYLKLTRKSKYERILS